MHALGTHVASATENNVSLKPVFMREHLSWPHLLRVTPDPAKAVSRSCPSGSCFVLGLGSRSQHLGSLPVLPGEQ